MADTPETRSPLKYIRKMYDWVVSLAHRKHSTMALAVLAFIESSFFPIPPDVLQIALSVSRPQKALWYATVSTIFSVLGGVFGYFIGLFLFDAVGQNIINALGYQQQFLTVGELYKNNAFLAVLAGAFTPIPYKVFTIAAGFWKIGLMPLIIGSIVGRAGRFFIIGGLFYIFGAKVKAFIDRYLNTLAVGVFVMVVLGVVALRYI